MTLAQRLATWRQDRMAFRREAITLEDGRPWGEVAEPWQLDDFRMLDSGQYRHAYIERPRGHAKTFDLGTEAVTELLLGPPGQRLYCAAADEDQARLLFEDVVGKFQRHPMLRGSVKVTARELIVTATGSRLRVLSNDAPTAYGLRPDVIMVDELAEWRHRGLWDSLWSATGKRPRCRMLVISTAGWDRTSIAWEVRQSAEQEADWYFSARGPCASWIRPEWVEQQRRTLPAHVFARLHESRWVEGAGAWLTAAEVDAVFTDELPQGAGAMAVGVDLGWARDRSAVVAVRHDRATGAVIIDHLLTWTPQPGRKVDFPEVERDVLELAKDRAPVIIDQWQGIHMAQRLQAQGVRVVLSWSTSLAEHRRKLFTTLLDVIRQGRLRSRPHERLRRELLAMEVRESGSGWRVDHPKGAGQHDDVVVALALAAAEVVSHGVVIDLDRQVILAPARATGSTWERAPVMNWEQQPTADWTRPVGAVHEWEEVEIPPDYGRRR